MDLISRTMLVEILLAVLAVNRNYLGSRRFDARQNVSKPPIVSAHSLLSSPPVPSK